jgi:polyhydroxyalkanoate synthesis regulator phasin
MFGFLKKLFGSADVNKDGKVDAQDAKVVVEEVKAEVKAAAVEVKQTAKKAATKAKAGVKKVADKAKAPRKPKSKA